MIVAPHSVKVSRWWYLLAVVVIAIESSISMPLLGVGLLLLLIHSNEGWYEILNLVVLSLWLGLATGLSWGGTLLLVWLATLAQRYVRFPSSPSQRFMILSLWTALIIEWWRGIVWSPSYVIGTLTSGVLLLLLSRLLYVKRQTPFPLVRSLSRFELFMSK